MDDLDLVGTGVTILLALTLFVWSLYRIIKGGAKSNAERFQLEVFYSHVGGGTSRFVIGKFPCLKEAQDELDDFASRSPDDEFRIWDTLKRKDVTQR